MADAEAGHRQAHYLWSTPERIKCGNVESSLHTLGSTRGLEEIYPVERTQRFVTFQVTLWVYYRFLVGVFWAQHLHPSAPGFQVTLLEQLQV